MEPSSIGFLLLLLIMGGGIAYLADMVGKKLGKKRLSLFGLRPRQTAALGTIFLGVLITAVTIGFALVASSGMRQSLLEGKRIQQELRQLEQEQTSRKEQNQVLSQKNAQLSAQSAKASHDLAVRQADLVSAKAKLAQLNGKIASLQGRVQSLSLDAQRKKRALDTANRNLLAVNSQLKDVKNALATNRRQLLYVTHENQDMQHKNLELVETTDKLKATQTQLEADKKDLEANLNTLKQSVQDLQTKEDQAQSKLRHAEEDLASIQGRLQTATERLANTQAELNDAEVKVGQLMNITDVGRTHPLIYRINEEVARLKVPAGVTQSQANGAITLFLRKARVAAQGRGATRASVFDHQGQTGDQIVQHIINQLTGSREANVIIGRSSLNAFRGEPVSLEVSIQPDPLVYLSGQMVAETVIDGSKGDAAVFQELTTFLQEKVSQKAMKDGMIPLSNSDVSFGQITQADVLQLIAKLHAVNRAIRVQAHAVGDTYAADPLKLEFRLR